MIRRHVPARADVGDDELADAVEALRRGGVVAYPTETFYGLAADPWSADAVRRVFTLKGRSFDQPLPLIAADMQQVADGVGTLTPLARVLARHGWPGPLTLIIPALPRLPADVHRGTGKVAVRVPDHPIARALARAAGFAVTSTSANISGEPPAATAEQVVSAFGERRDAPEVLIDGGATPGGLPSTIVDATGDVPVLVRPGAIAWDRVLRFSTSG